VVVAIRAGDGVAGRNGFAGAAKKNKYPF
jgi:hypothetical protein